MYVHVWLGIYLQNFIKLQFSGWNDIAGLEFVKKTVKEVVVLPLKRPDIFHGLRAPPKGRRID